MKVIAYERAAASEFHIHAGSRATCFYVPDLACVIGTETLGTFGREDNFVTRDAGILKEAEQLRTMAELGATTTEFEGKGVTVSKMKMLDLDEEFIKGTVDILDVVAAARLKVTEGMKILLNEIK